MPGVLQPDKTSRENIRIFLESIEDEDLKYLIIENLDQILAIGADRGDRESFFIAIKELIEKRIRITDGNQDN